MDIFRLFRDQMEQAAKLRKLEEKLERKRRSLARRDRRIGDLKKKLKASRATSDARLAEARQIIAGLEEALMLHRPRVELAEDARIADLEARLTAMTEYADTLQQRASA